ncbi:hypothetical protein ACFOLJ_06625 [Rugamonas sp. CCM 8940]
MELGPERAPRRDKFRYDLSNSAYASLGAQSPTSFHLATFDYRRTR